MNLSVAGNNCNNNFASSYCKSQDHQKMDFSFVHGHPRDNHEPRVLATKQKQKSIKVGKVPHCKGVNRYNQFITHRFGNLSYLLFAWAYGFVLFGWGWYSFDRSVSVLNLNTKWCPAVATGVALVVLVLHIIRLSGNWKGFVNDTTHPTMLSYMAIAPLIVTALGMTILLDTKTDGNGFWYAGNTFIWCGTVLSILIFGYWIYITFFYNVFHYSELNAAWLLPFGNIFFVNLTNPILIHHYFSTFMQGLWGISALILPFFLIVVYRYLFYQKVPANLTHFPILAGALALVPLAFINTFNIKFHQATSSIFVMFMLGAVLLLLVFTYLYFGLHCKKHKFSYGKTINIFTIPFAANLLFTSAVSNIATRPTSSPSDLSFFSKPLDDFVIVQLIFVFLLFTYTLVGNCYLVLYEITGRPPRFAKLSFFHRYFVLDKP